MFFYLSKIIWFVIQPIGLLFLLMAFTLFATIFSRPKTAMFTATCAMLVIVFSAWTNLGQMMLNPLEERFARPAVAPDEIAGIIILGGGMAGAVNLARGGYELEDAADRFVEGAILARRYPHAKLVISGGSGALIADGEGDAETASRLMVALGVEENRLVLENKSRNTQENAALTRKLINPKPGEVWLLVTSAFHMPRSMALFRVQGFDVTPWPVDYRTPGPRSLGYARRSPVKAMEETSLALREWVGLAAYRLTGKISRLFPSP